ncbi:MAG: lytic transglycosylase domain-containing protein [Chloroflexi bacterium]|nr:lytic transglycosylase domain-containing protein [Chloroflexota bacterium]
MSPRQSVPPSAQAAVSDRGGCLPVFILSPMAVVIVGIMMTFLVSGVTLDTTSSSGLGGDLVASGDSKDGQLAGDATFIAVLFTPEVQYWAQEINTWALSASLDANLVATVMQIESCGDPQALSRSGAIGLFQVMPFHFTTTDHPFDPATNALRGLGYLQRSLEASGGNIRLALAGYNGGISVINRPESEWADETRRYVYWGSGIFGDAAQSAAESERLNEWLGRGGAGLCRQASQRLGLP